MKKLVLLLWMLAGAVWCRAQNHAPDIIGNASAIGCFGDTMCFELSTSDLDNDSTYLWWQPAHKGVFKKNSGKFEGGNICFYLAENDFSAITLYNFDVYASDGKDTVKRVFGFYILDLPANTMPLLQPVTCNTIDIQPQGDSSLNWPKYKVEGLRLKITDSANKNVFNSATSRYHNAIFLNTLTPYAYSLTYTMRTGCTHTVTDSIYINKGVKSAITSSQNLQNPVNEWTQLDLQAQIADSNGYTAFDYLWLPDSLRTTGITVYPVRDIRYTVVVKTPDGCENRADANIKVTLTARDEINKKRITISPNPATDFISITGLPESASLQITDVAGRETYFQQQNSYERVDISSLPKGVYFITVASKDFYERVKLLVKE